MENMANALKSKLLFILLISQYSVEYVPIINHHLINVCYIKINSDNPSNPPPPKYLDKGRQPYSKITGESEKKKLYSSSHSSPYPLNLEHPPPFLLSDTPRPSLQVCLLCTHCPYGEHNSKCMFRIEKSYLLFHLFQFETVGCPVHPRQPGSLSRKRGKSDI